MHFVATIRVFYSGGGRLTQPRNRVEFRRNRRRALRVGSDWVFGFQGARPVKKNIRPVGSVILVVRERLDSDFSAERRMVSYR